MDADIIRMAREAGFANVRGGLMDNGELSDYWDCWPHQLERFYNLARAAEREACAVAGAAAAMAGQDYASVAAAIRNRGKA